MINHQLKIQLPVGLPIQLAAIIIGAGAAAVVFGIFWIFLTMPVALLIEGNFVSTNGQQTVQFINLFVGLMPILFGLVCVAWGYVKAVEEREYGQMLPE
jgi:hypothetical protein